MFKGAKLDGATGAIALVFFCLEGLKYHILVVLKSGNLEFCEQNLDKNQFFNNFRLAINSKIKTLRSLAKKF